MKKISIVLLCTFAFAVMASAQSSYLAEPQVAVFYPKDYQSEAHSPSPIFLHELAPIGSVPSNWPLKPVYSENDSMQIMTIAIGAGDDLYGTGEVVGDLRRNDKEVLFWNKDNYLYRADEGKHLYQTHPWVLGVRPDGSAYGVIADNTWKSRLTTHGEIRFESWGPAFRTIIIEGKDAQEVLGTLARLTGPMEMPPLWAIGYQQCRYSYVPDTRVMEVADSLRLFNIPCDVMWMDIDYMDHYKVFTFDPKGFSNPLGLQQYLHDRKMKSVYMVDPGVKVEEGYFVYEQAKEYDYFIKKADGTDFVGKVWPGDCSFPDFTRSEVRTWWSGLTQDLMRKGADGLWNDMNDPSVFDGVGGTMDEDAVHMPGEAHYSYQSHLRYHNVYGTYMIRASRNGALNAFPDKRPFILTRSNFLGGQRFGATWTGDNESSWEHMQMSIPMTINLGLSGQPFNGPDLGGFGNNCNDSLLVNWACSGVYFPFVRNHACNGTAAQEPWVFGEEVLNAYRTAVNRRYVLLPYIYTLFREASENGMPVMRPLWMSDAKDLSLRAEQQSYLLGADLCIVPSWAKNPVLPKGDWREVKFEETADKYQAQVLQRPGSIIPMSNLVQSTVDYATDSLTLIVNLDAEGNASGTLYEDAGDGFGYRKGEYVISQIKAEVQGKQLTVTIEQVEGNRASEVKNLRLGIMQKGKMKYSPWTAGKSVTMKVR